MNEHPILFSKPMVQAILEGRKTQTRRVVNPQPVYYEVPPMIGPSPSFYGPGWYWNMDKAPGFHSTKTDDGVKNHFAAFARMGLTKYGVGDCLWVRETWNTWGTYDSVRPSDLPNWLGVSYIADMKDPKGEACGKIRPSIFMPRWASRITLEVVSVRVERVQDISETDAIAEGVDAVSMADVPRQATWNRRGDFRQLWDRINAERGFGWDVNPWVWVVEFRKVAP